MITGKVSSRRPLVAVTFHLIDQPDISIEFVVDTGFGGFLTLLLQAVLAMESPYRYHIPASLADDCQVQIPVYEASIIWDGSDQNVTVLAMGKRPLLGASLMENRALFILFREGSTLTISDVAETCLPLTGAE